MTTPEATPITAAGRALLADADASDRLGPDYQAATLDAILAIEREAVLGLKERDAAEAFASVFLEASRETKFESVTLQAAELMHSGCPEDAAFFWAAAIGEGVRSAADLAEALRRLDALVKRHADRDGFHCLCDEHLDARAVLAAHPEGAGE